MGKSAFLFYPDNWIIGTMGMTFQEKGCYFELLMYQFNNGKFSEEDAKQALNKCYKHVWHNIKDKFKTDGTYFWNERLEKEINKRQILTESRRKNIQNRYKKSTSVDTSVDTSVATLVEGEKTLKQCKSDNNVQNDDKKTALFFEQNKTSVFDSSIHISIKEVFNKIINTVQFRLFGEKNNLTTEEAEKELKTFIDNRIIAGDKLINAKQFWQYFINSYNKKKDKKLTLQEIESKVFKEFKAAYFDFHINILKNPKPKFKDTEKESMNTLIEYFKDACGGDEIKAFEAFKTMFENWNKLNIFNKQWVDINQIANHIVEIINSLRNGQNTNSKGQQRLEELRNW